MSVGQRIKQRRTEIDMTITQVASLTGLTAGFISQVENDRASLSLESLGKIAEALNTRTVSLIADTVFKPEVIRRDARPSIAFPNQVDMEILSIPFGRKLQITKAVLPDGYQAGNQTHTHEGEEWILVMEGEVQVIQGEFAVVLYEGDSIHLDGSEPHLCQNVSGKPASVIIAVTPPANIPLLKSE